MQRGGGGESEASRSFAREKGPLHLMENTPCHLLPQWSSYAHKLIKIITPVCLSPSPCPPTPRLAGPFSFLHPRHRHSAHLLLASPRGPPTQPEVWLKGDRGGGGRDGWRPRGEGREGRAGDAGTSRDLRRWFRLLLFENLNCRKHF